MINRRDLLKGAVVSLALAGLSNDGDDFMVDFNESDRSRTSLKLYHGATRTDPGRAPWISDRNGVRSLRESLDLDCLRIVAEDPRWVRGYSGTLPSRSLRGRAKLNLESMLEEVGNSRVVLSVSELPERVRDSVGYFSNLVNFVSEKIGGGFTLELDSKIPRIRRIMNELGLEIRDQELEDVRLALGVDYGEDIPSVLRGMSVDSIGGLGVNLHLYNDNLPGDLFENSSRIFYDYIREVGAQVRDFKRSFSVRSRMPISVSEYGVCRKLDVLTPQEEASLIGLNIINMARTFWVDAHCYFQQTADGVRSGGLWTSDAVKLPAYEVLRTFSRAFPWGSAIHCAGDSKDAGYIAGINEGLRYLGIVNKTEKVLELNVDLGECDFVRQFIGAEKPSMKGRIMQGELGPREVEVYEIR